MAEQESHSLRSMRIEVNRDSKGKVTGHTVHLEHMPKSSRSGAFMASPPAASHPFESGKEHEMIGHVKQHLGIEDEPEEDI